MSKLSVEELINQGRRKFITRPLYLGFGFIPVTFFTFVYLNKFFNSTFQEYSVYFPFLSFSIPLFLSVLYVQINIGSWKIWAYENVNNLHMFHRKALAEGIFSKKSGFLFLRKDQRDKIKEIETSLRFSKEKVSKQYIQKNHQLTYYYSRTTILVELLFIIPFTVISFIETSNIESLSRISFENLLSIVFGMIGLYFSTKKIFNLIDRKPKLIINNQGIKNRNGKVIKWNQFSSARIKRKGGYSGFNREVLELLSKNNNIEIKLNGLSINQHEISDYLLRKNK